MKPFFSVIIPTYNQAQLLKECLESLELQTFSDFEVVIVDNHSTDDTLEVVSSFKNLRVNLLEINNEGVVAKSRNKGIKEAKGEWVCLLDSDDSWFAEKLEEVYNKIQASQIVDVVSHCMVLNRVTTGQQSIMKWDFSFDNLYKFLLLHGNKFVNSALCIRRNYLVEHNIWINEEKKFKSVEDYDMIMNIARTGGVFAYVNKPLGYYNVYGGNMSMSDFHLVNLENLLYEHVFYIQTFEQNKDKLWKEVRAGVFIKRANSFLRKKQYLKSLVLYFRCVILSPRRFFRYLKDRIKLLFFRLQYRFIKK